MKSLIGCLILVSASPVFAQQSCLLKKPTVSKIELSVSADAKSLEEKLKSQGFDCSTPAPSYERGVRCRGKVDGYPEAVNIFIPSQYQEQASVPIAVHFHGHNSSWCEKGTSACHFNMKNGDGDYGKFLTNSGSNQLLVIPESQGHEDTYLSAFKKPEDFEKFLNGVKKGVGVTTWSSLSISSHSGGDVVINKLAQWYEGRSAGETLKKLHSVALFDSLYANRDGIAALPAAMKKNDPNSRFLGSYVVGAGASTTAHMNWLRTKVPASSQWQYKEVKTVHMSIMKDGGMDEYLKDSCE